MTSRLQRRLAWHQALQDPVRDPRNALPWLPNVRRWQAQRLERSFRHYLDDPVMRPAARFFLTDVYGDRDFAARDADIARVMPLMQGLLPQSLLDTVADAIELASLTHAFDLRMAEVLTDMAPRRKQLDDALYARAYRETGLPRLRQHQIALIGWVGEGLASAVRMRGIGTMLRLARGPARAAGFSDLQLFLEHGFDAFAKLGDVEGFLAEIKESETVISQRLFAGDPAPFAEL